MKPSMIFWTVVHARQRDTVGTSVTMTTTTTASTPPPPLVSWAPPAEVQPFDRLATHVARCGAAEEADAAALCAATPDDKLDARGARAGRAGHALCHEPLLPPAGAAAGVEEVHRGDRHVVGRMHPCRAGNRQPVLAVGSTRQYILAELVPTQMQRTRGIPLTRGMQHAASSGM